MNEAVFNNRIKFLEHDKASRLSRNSSTRTSGERERRANLHETIARKILTAPRRRQHQPQKSSVLGVLKNRKRFFAYAVDTPPHAMLIFGASP